MGRIKTSAELRDMAEKAKAREDARTKGKVESTATPRRAEDTIAVFYRNPLDKGDTVYEINVAESNLFALGGSTSDATLGITRAGVFAAKPQNTDPIAITKGSKLAIVRLNWYKGDATVARETTPWNTVWFRRYDTQTINGRQRSHFSVPFSMAAATAELNEIIDRFETLFSDNTVKEALIGDLGIATLTLGYGNQYSVLATKK
jgi:hypothetical protein